VIEEKLQNDDQQTWMALLLGCHGNQALEFPEHAGHEGGVNDTDEVQQLHRFQLTLHGQTYSLTGLYLHHSCLLVYVTVRVYPIMESTLTCICMYILCSTINGDYYIP